MTSYLDILRVLDAHPELRQLNAHQERNERFFAALATEQLYPRSYRRSQEMLERANALIPLAAQTFSKSRLQYPQPSPLFLSHGSGGRCFDIDGNEYVDLVSALLPNILGYCDPDVDMAIRRQLDAGISLSLASELEIQLAHTLSRLIPCAEAVRFGKTGTDATTAAVRLARAYTHRDKVLIYGGYHGWADWSTERARGVPTAVSAKTLRIKAGAPLPPVHHGDFCAVIVEPDAHTPEQLRRLRVECDGKRTLLIFDEIITGFRWDLGGAQKVLDITPDLATFGKSMANGMPLSAIVGRRDIMQLMEPPDNIFYSGTFFGETLSLAASIATIAKLERENVIPQLWDKARHLRNEINSMLQEAGLQNIITLSYNDPLARITFDHGDGATAEQLRALFMREMIGAGVLIIGSHNLCHAHDKNDLEKILRAWDYALHMICMALDEGAIDELLANTHIPAGTGVRSA